ncbi:SpoU rRNA Methylase family protein [Jatrophihabitans endophyticus]|uniref:SpoU rRNA Methylase family protein n=1 Tax=Jatrophihabitans endophyticus TaxID=1206085 RepID=A0A1M5HJ54_9ACTN|nr:SpoU rRNA Methylase family protein [Jatrophihabitans endophyticus]
MSRARYRVRVFEQVRHRPPTPLAAPRELVVACAPMRSNVNLSTIARTAGCCGVERMIVCGHARLDRTIARDGADSVGLEVRNSLPPVLKTLRADGYRLVGLEQTTNSADLHHYAFTRRTALVIGNERAGLSEAELALLDDTIEIPVWGLPYSYNVATATAMALYEYCRQFPS